MITKYFFVLLAIFITGCYTPNYIPSVESIDINQYGSYIKVSHIKVGTIDGELIALDSSSIIVLSESIRTCVKIPLKDINSFTLRYARPKNYAWSIPLFSLVSITHGFYGIISMPINLIITISESVGGNLEYRYNDKEISHKKLSMFARFPQGIPPNINIKMIR